METKGYIPIYTILPRSMWMNKSRTISKLFHQIHLSRKKLLSFPHNLRELALLQKTERSQNDPGKKKRRKKKGNKRRRQTCWKKKKKNENQKIRLAQKRFMREQVRMISSEWVGYNLTGAKVSAHQCINSSVVVCPNTSAEIGLYFKKQCYVNSRSWMDALK